MAVSNVTRFGGGDISTSGGTSASITVGPVSVGDLVVVAANCLTGSVRVEPSTFTDSLGNTVTARLHVTSSTFGPYTVYEIIVTNAGTMTLTAGGAAGTTVVAIWGSQWTGAASWTYDANGAVNDAWTAGGGNGTDQQTADITFGAQSVAFAFFGGTGIQGNPPTSYDAGWTAYAPGGTSNGGVTVADQAMSGGTGHFHAVYTSYVYTGGTILSYSYTLGGSASPDEDAPAPVRAPSRSWAAAALALAALSGGVDELPPQAAATIVEDVPAYASPPPLLTARSAPTVAPDESWFASAYDDEAILCPLRCVGPVAQRQRTIAAQVAAYQQGPHEDLWFQSTPDDAPTSTWAPPPVAWLYAEEASAGLTTAPDELPVAAVASIVDDDTTWQPGPPSQLLLYAEESAQALTAPDESWFASAVDEDAIYCPVRCGGPMARQAAVAAAQAAASMYGPGDEVVPIPGTIPVDDEVTQPVVPPRFDLPRALATAALPTFADELWFQSTPCDDETGYQAAPFRVRVFYPPPAAEEFVPGPIVDDEAVRPVTPPRFDLRAARAVAALQTFADEPWFASAVDDEVTQPVTPPPLQFGGPALAALGFDDSATPSSGPPPPVPCRASISVGSTAVLVATLSEPVSTAVLEVDVAIGTTALYRVTITVEDT